MCSNSTIVLYILFILSCNTCYFQFVCSLFVLFCCSDTNTLRPCSTDAIGASHHLPPPATHQEIIVALPFRSLLTSVPPSYPCPIWSVRPIQPVASQFSRTSQRIKSQFLRSEPKKTDTNTIQPIRSSLSSEGNPPTIPILIRNTYPW